MGVYAKTTYVFLCLVATIYQGYSNTLSDDCKDGGGKTCVEIVQNFLNKVTDGLSPDFDADCKWVRQRLECFGSCQKEIDKNTMAGVGLKLVDFFCDASQRQKVDAMLQAECGDKKNDTYKQTYGQLFESCEKLFTKANDLDCSGVNGVVSCVRDGLKEACGSEVLPGTEEYMRIVAPDLMAHCVSES